MEKPELLSPAGSWERLEAAVRYGADAVYLGGDRFGLRAACGNFGGEALPKAVPHLVLHGGSGLDEEAIDTGVPHLQHAAHL